MGEFLPRAGMGEGGGIPIRLVFLCGGGAICLSLQVSYVCFDSLDP